jgi:hypothetical protein
MSTFTYKGIEITLNDRNGNFTATVNGFHFSKPSLKAMKDHIEKAVKQAFGPISVLVEKGADLVRGKAIALVPAYGRHSKLLTFSVAFDDNRTQAISTCYRDCPEAIAAHKALETQRAETRKINEKRSEEEDALQEKLSAFLIDPKSSNP